MPASLLGMPERWTLHHIVGDSTATCLDGSAPAFYVRPPVATAGQSSTKFAIFLEGGGWCVSEQDCLGRMHDGQGSSAPYKAHVGTPGSGGGYFDAPTPLGAEFSDATVVFVKYCDASSFAGDASHTFVARKDLRLGHRLVKAGAPISIRWAGRPIVDAMLSQLLRDFGLATATDVLLSGCSAGGLAALLVAETVRHKIRESGAPLRRFKVLVLSGVFHHASPYAEQMRELDRFANVSASIAPSCARRFAAGDRWRCLVGLEPLHALPPDIPAFLEQSAFDRWQTACVLGAAASRFELVGCSAAGGWDQCLHFTEPFTPAGALPARIRRSACSKPQLRSLERFQSEFMAELRASHALQRPGYGAFLHGCHSHCPTNLRRFAIGGVALETAVLNWWRGVPVEPSAVPSAALQSASHVHTGCLTSWATFHNESLERPPPGARRRQPQGASRLAACTPTCSPLYAWPDQRAAYRRRAQAIELALRGAITSPELIVKTPRPA